MASFPSPREPFLDQRLHALLTQRGKELLGLMLIGVALLLGLTLWSYAPDDPGWMAASDDPVSNRLGRPGAAVAAPLMIIAGKASWGLVLAFAVWGLRLMLHRGQGTILARGVFLPVAVALATVWAASLVPGPGWAQDFGLGGMFGDTVLGMILSALPISTTFGFNLLTALLFVGVVTLWLYVMGGTMHELAALGRFMLAGLILTYAGIVAILIGLLRGGGRGGARLIGGLGAMRLPKRAAAGPEAGSAHPEAGYPPGFHSGPVHASPGYPAASFPAAGYPHASPPAAPIGGPGGGPRLVATPPLHGQHAPQEAFAAGPLHQHAVPQHAGAGGWQHGTAQGEPAAQRIARVVRATVPQPEPSAQPDMMARPAPRLRAEPALRDQHSEPPAAGRGFLGRVSDMGRRLGEAPADAAAQTADGWHGHLPNELVDPAPPPHADAPPPQPDRVLSRITDLLRNRKKAKPVLRFDPSAPPPRRNAPPLATALRPEPRLTGGANEAGFAAQAEAEMPLQMSHSPAQPLVPAQTQPVATQSAPPVAVAPQAPASTGLFGLLPGFGWTASVQSAELPMPAALPPAVSAPAPLPVQPGYAHHDSQQMAGRDTDDLIDDQDPYGAPPAPRSAPVYNRRVVQQAARKAPAPSVRARAEAEPRLPLDPAPPAYELPPLALLSDPRMVERYTLSDEALEENARMLESVLDDYGVRGEIVAVRPGPVVTLYELEPAPGLKASRVIGLADDIARSMSALSARVSTVPGRSVIGIELPNARREKVLLREILASRDFDNDNLRLPLALGKDIGGESVVANLAKMPHLLIAGTTGSGKSVAINTMILSLLYKLTPEECRLIMIDPKMLELSVYDGIPHLLSPVVTDPKKAVTALKWVVAEMEERYRKMSKMGVRNIEGYNGRVREALAKGDMFKRTIQTGFDDNTGDPVFETEEFAPELLPFIVVVVDEMADLMMVAGKEIEACIQRLAQMARASGIHLIMATQRPSVDVITGTIKANFPTRISFQVTSKIDSRTILGEMGAEHLRGMGDMLYMAGGSKITRIHGPFVSDEEVEEVVTHLKSFGPPSYETGVLDGPDSERESEIDAVLGLGDGTPSEDALYDQAVAIVARDRKCSTSYIQRKLGIGYNKAARLVEQMEDQGVVSRANQVGKREILVPEA